MAEVLARFSHRVRDGAAAFRAQACGAPMSDGRWTAWIEFIPLDGGQPLPIAARDDAAEPDGCGILGRRPRRRCISRARCSARRVRSFERRIESAEPAFDEPAADLADPDDSPPPSDAVLDPVSVYQKGEGLLRQQLRALSSWHLVNIIRAYGLSQEPASVLNQLPAPALIARIVVACRRLTTR